MEAFSAIVPLDADASNVGDAITKIVRCPLASVRFECTLTHEGWRRSRLRGHGSGPYVHAASSGASGTARTRLASWRSAHAVASIGG
jgi:hypothetical protein